LVVYPAITDISGNWSVVHAVGPLAVPAAVGVRLVVDRGVSGYRSGDYVSVALAAIVLLAAAGQMGAVAAETSFVMPQDEDNELVQYGQPGSDMRETLNAVERVAPPNEGTDVLYYGEHFHVPGDYDKTDPGGVAGTNWFNRLPLPWYTERAGAQTASTLRLEEPSSTGVTDRSPSIEGTDVPVVITRAKHYGDVAPLLEDRGYESWTYELTSTNTHVVVFVNTSAPGYAQT
ncbi:MAG: TIGR03663 family protein, partial [Halobacterium sp.]